MAGALGDPAVLVVALAARSARPSPGLTCCRTARRSSRDNRPRPGRAGITPARCSGRRLLVVALAERPSGSAVDAHMLLLRPAGGAPGAAQADLVRTAVAGRAALMHGDLALADEHARELGEMAERAGSVNARLLGLVQRLVRSFSRGGPTISQQTRPWAVLTCRPPAHGAAQRPPACAAFFSSGPGGGRDSAPRRRVAAKKLHAGVGGGCAPPATRAQPSWPTGC